MAVELATAYVSLVPSARGIGSALSRQMIGPANVAAAKAGEGASKSFGTRFASGIRRFALGASVGLGLAGVAAVKFGKSFIDAAEESRKIGAQTNAVIKSTGQVAGISAAGVGRLAEQLSKKTGIDDELIQSGANVLLTFTKVRDEAGRGNDVFSQGVTVANDMSVALGQDMQSSVIQVGKALNDPIKGITALQRVGVSFTAQQRSQIEAMVASGDTLGAQKVILRELNTEFGGSAAAQASASDKLGVAWGNIAETLGGFLLPLVDKFANWLNSALPVAVEIGRAAFDRVRGAAESIGNWWADNGPGIIAMVSRVFGAISGWVSDVIPPIRAWVSDVLANLGNWWDEHGPTIVSIAGQIADKLVSLGAGAVRSAQFFVRNWDKVWPVMQKIGTVVGVIAIPALIRLGVVSLASAAKSAVAWAIQTAGPVAAGAVYVAQTAIMVARWAFLGAQSLFHAARVAAAWVISMGPIGLIVAAVVALVVVVVKNWDTIKRVITAVAGAVWRFVVDRFNDIKDAVMFALTTAKNVVVMVFNAIKSFLVGVITGIWNFVSTWFTNIKDAIVNRIEEARARLLLIWNAIKFVVLGAITWIKDQISEKFAAAKELILGAFRTVRDTVGGILTRIRETIGGAADWVKEKVSEKFTAVKDGILNAFRAVRDTMGRIWDSIKSKVKTPVNAIIRFINKLLGGLDRVLQILPGDLSLSYRIPILAESGAILNRGRAGGMGMLAAGGVAPFKTNGPRAIVGEGNPRWPEYVIPTDPKYRGRASRLHAAAARDLGVPGYAIGGIIGDITDAIGDAVGGVTGAFRKGAAMAIFGPVKAAFDKALKTIPWKFLRDLGGAFVGWLYDFVKGADAKGFEEPAGGRGGAVPSGGGGPGGGVQQWREIALAALAYTGQSAGWLGDLLTQMNHESGGNPRATNLWDSNFLKGTPSMGLMQTIAPTFYSYARELAGRGIFDPFANIVAAIRYTVARYGDLGAWRRRGFKGYAEGAWEVGTMGGYTHPGEMVLSKRMADVVRSLPGGPGGRSGPAVEIAAVNLYDGVDVDLFSSRLEFEVAGGRL